MSDRIAGSETARPDVQAHVPADARSILELGCSAGALGAALKARASAPVTVIGVELDPEHARGAAERLDRVIVGDAEAFIAGPPPPEAPFDCLIAADVLEHLVDPWTTLERAVALVRPGATVIVSVPNVLFARPLLRGGGAGRLARRPAPAHRPRAALAAGSRRGLRQHAPALVLAQRRRG